MTPFVAGLGSHHGDDQAGWLVIDELFRRGYPAQRLARLRHPADLLDVMDGGESLVICDACTGNGEIGAIRRFRWEAGSTAGERGVFVEADQGTNDALNKSVGIVPDHRARGCSTLQKSPHPNPSPRKAGARGISSTIEPGELDRHLVDSGNEDASLETGLVGMGVLSRNALRHMECTTRKAKDTSPALMESLSGHELRHMECACYGGGRPQRGSHDMSLSEVLELGRVVGCIPATVEIWTLEGVAWVPGTEPTDLLRLAAVRVSEVIQKGFPDA